MKKLLVILSVMALSVVILTACSSKKEETTKVTETEVVTKEETDKEIETVTEVETETETNSEVTVVIPRVTALKGPTAMGMVKMMSDYEESYDFTVSAAIDEVTTNLVKGDIDIAAVPANLASVLYNNTDGEIQVMAINTLGVLYIVENQESVNTVADLRGKVIYATGKGATPEAAINYILKQNGLEAGVDVTIEFKAEPAECISALAEDIEGIAMLPQPFVTTAQMQNENLRIALDLTEEWERVQAAERGSSLLTGVVVVRKEFAETNKEVVNVFLDQYASSVEFVNAELEEAAALIEAYDIVKAQVAKIAIPYCNIAFIEGVEMEEKLLGYLEVLFAQNPKSVGGAIPSEDFYYRR